MKFYLVLRHHASPIDDRAGVVEHFTWMRAQHERGTVLISGPVRTARSVSMCCARRRGRTQPR
nr:hypothetical protein [Mycobacterium sp.]